MTQKHREKRPIVPNYLFNRCTLIPRLIEKLRFCAILGGEWPNGSSHAEAQSTQRRRKYMHCRSVRALRLCVSFVYQLVVPKLGGEPKLHVKAGRDALPP